MDGLSESFVSQVPENVEIIKINMSVFASKFKFSVYQTNRNNILLMKPCLTYVHKKLRICIQEMGKF